MRTSNDEYKEIDGERVLWNVYDYKNQYWVHEGKRDTRTLEELQASIKRTYKGNRCPDCGGQMSADEANASGHFHLDD